MEALVSTVVAFESEASADFAPSHAETGQADGLNDGVNKLPVTPSVPHRRVSRVGKGRVGAGLRAALSSRASGLLLEYVRVELGAALQSDASAGDELDCVVEGAHCKQRLERLSGVCVEFCSSLGRLDLLVGPIFRAFRRSPLAHSVLLDVVEPYLLTRQLGYLSPPMLIHFARHCQVNGTLRSLESCLLKLRIELMPQLLLIAVCSRLRLVFALIRSFNVGAADFHSPVEYMLRQVTSVTGNQWRVVTALPIIAGLRQEHTMP